MPTHSEKMLHALYLEVIKTIAEQNKSCNEE
jgi:hypothetical protein